jgi:hypothetical protein
MPMARVYYSVPANDGWMQRDHSLAFRSLIAMQQPRLLAQASVDGIDRLTNCQVVDSNVVGLLCHHERDIRVTVGLHAHVQLAAYRNSENREQTSKETVLVVTSSRWLRERKWYP